VFAEGKAEAPPHRSLWQHRRNSALRNSSCRKEDLEESCGSLPPDNRRAPCRFLFEQTHQIFVEQGRHNLAQPMQIRTSINFLPEKQRLAVV